MKTENKCVKSRYKAYIIKSYTKHKQLILTAYLLLARKKI